MGEVQSVGSWLSPSAEPSGPLTATARRAAVSGQAEFSVFHAVAERFPQICCEDQHRTLLVFRVTDGHDPWQAGGHFHAVARSLMVHERLGQLVWIGVDRSGWVVC